MVDYLTAAAAVPGWRQGAEAKAVFEASHSCPDKVVLVEIGAFLGRSTILLAGARKLRGSGQVHCVDPFDGSGDAFSVPYYRDILTAGGSGSPREQFDRNIRQAGLADWVAVHQQRAAEAAAAWNTPIDLLLLDGDQSPEGALEAFRAWTPHLKPGGILIVSNSAPRDYAETHDGNRRVVVAEVVNPRYVDVRLVDFATFATKASA